MLLLLYPRYSCGYSYVCMECSVFVCSAHALMNHFWSRNASSLSIKEAIQNMFGFTLNEPSQMKTNDLNNNNKSLYLKPDVRH